MGGHDVLSSVVSTQVDLHAEFGGVVPEIASRAHLDLLNPVVARAIVEAGVDEQRIDAVACTVGPGLIGALLVGVSAAKALALAWDVPVRRRQPPRGAPLRGVPRGSRRWSSRSWCCSCRAGTRCWSRCAATATTACSARRSTTPPARRSTRSPASSASAIPAGRRSTTPRCVGDPAAIAFPRAMLNDGLDFSFSGLKTSVVNYVRKHPDVGVGRCGGVVPDGGRRRAGRQGAPGGRAQVGATGIVLGGGVAANSLLRERIARRVRRGRDRGLPAEPGDVHRQRGDDRRRRLAPPAQRRPDAARRRRHAQPPPRLHPLTRSQFTSLRMAELEGIGQWRTVRVNLSRSPNGGVREAPPISAPAVQGLGRPISRVDIVHVCPHAA